jgi:A/G-specific adenine glycosylase
MRGGTVVKTWRLGCFRRSVGGRRYWVKSWPYLPPRLAAELTQWGAGHFRNYPWRRTRDPFSVLVAEMLLRRTSGPHVAQVYPRFMRRYSTPDKLAAAGMRELKQMLRPLGLTSWRAASLREMARFLLQRYDGEVPADPTLLEQIPHVGPYTARAVGCFVFGLPLPIVDVNVIRVLVRFTGLSTPGPRPHLQPSVWERSLRSLPEGEVALYNWALLDLAAQVCGRRPHCGECPLAPGCATRAK